MKKFQVIHEGDPNSLDEFEASTVEKFGDVLTFQSAFGPRVYTASKVDWAEVEKFSYEA